MPGFDTFLDSCGGRCTRLRAALFFAIVSMASSAKADWVKTYEWSAQVGLGGIVTSPSDPHRVYAFPGDARWFLSSFDGGLTWQRTPEVALHSYVMDLAVDPIDAATVYARISSGVAPGLYKSTDGGMTLVQLAKDAFFSDRALVAIDPKHVNIIYRSRSPDCQATCTPGGVVKSTDGGLTWSDTARLDNTTFAMTIDPNDPSILYASGYDVPMSRKTGGLYRTTDGGVTWPSMFPGLTYISYLMTDARSRVYAIAGDQFESLLLRSSDHGVTWSHLSINVAPPDPSSRGEGPWPNLTAVAVDPRRNETLYVSSYTHGVLSSYDDGVTWQPLGELPDKFVNTLAVTSKGVVLAVTRTGIYRWEPSPPRRRAARR